MSDKAAVLSFGVDPSGAKTGAAAVVRSLDEIRAAARSSTTAYQQQSGAFDQYVKSMVTGAGMVRTALVSLGAGFAGLRAAQLIKQTIELSARYNELGIGLTRVAKNVNISSEQVGTLESALRKTGISAIQARQSILSMVQANMDLTQATKLARVAQDAAVVGQVNSSDALQRIIYGLQTAQPEMLRTLGLTVNFEQAYAKMAATLKVNTNALSNEQRAQARLNAVMEAGGKITGLYEASMTSASKQLRSTERYVQDLQVQMGQLAQPGYAKAVFLYSDALKALSQNLDVAITGVGALAGAFVAPRLAAGLKSMLDGMKRLKDMASQSGYEKRLSGAGDDVMEAANVKKLAASEHALALSKEAVARADLKAAKTSEDRHKAILRLSAAEKEALMTAKQRVMAQAQFDAAMVRSNALLAQSTVATRVATVATKAFSTALAFVGGWTGVAIIAAMAAMAKYASTVSEASRAESLHGDELSKYADRIKRAEENVTALSAAERARVEQAKALAQYEAQRSYATQKAELGKPAGGGFFGSLKSDQMLSAAPAMRQSLRAFADEARKSGDVEKYRQQVTALFASVKNLTPAQIELRKALDDQAVTLMKQGMLVDDLAGKLPKLAGTTLRTAEAMVLSEQQVTLLTKALDESKDSQAKAALAQRIGAKAADEHAEAAKKLGLPLKEFEAQLNGTATANRSAAEVMLASVVAGNKAEKQYASLGKVTKGTKEEVARFTAGVWATVASMAGTRRPIDDLNEQIDALRVSAKGVGTDATKALERDLIPALRAAFSSKQAKEIADTRRAMDDQVGAILRSRDATARMTVAQKSGAAAVEELRMREAAMAAAREKGLSGVAAVVQGARLYTAMRADQAEQLAQQTALTVRETQRQIAAMNAEADAYAKGGKAVSDFTRRMALLKLLRDNPGMNFFDAVGLVAQLDAAETRLKKVQTTGKIAQEAALEAARGIQQSIAGAISDGFSGSLRDVEAYGKQLLDIFKNIAAQIAAAFAFKKLGIGDAIEKLSKGDLSDFMQGGLLKGKSGLTRAAGGALVGGAVGYSTGNAGMGALSGAATGFAVGGPVGAAAGAVAGLVGGMLGHAKAMREEQRRIEEATKAYKRSMQDFIDSFISPLDEMQRRMKDIAAWGSEQARAAAGIYKINLTGGNGFMDAGQLSATADATRAQAEAARKKGGFASLDALKLDAFATLLDDTAKTVAEAMVKLATERAKLENSVRDELSARAADAAGRSEEAEAIRRTAAERAEVERMVQEGFAQTTIEELKRVQVLEAAAAAAKKATDMERERQDFSLTFMERMAQVSGDSGLAALVSAEGTRTADQRMAKDLLDRKVISEAQYDEFLGVINKAFEQALAERQEKFATAREDLGVRKLSAMGFADAAADEAFRLDQKRELAAAEKDVSAEGKAYAAALKEVLEAEKNAREESKKRAEDARKLALKEATEDLEVRALMAEGNTAEAEAKRVALAAQREMNTALKDTSVEGIAYAAALEKVQKAEKAATEAATAKANAATLKSLDQRILMASGKTYEGEAMATDIARSQELATAANKEIEARMRLLYSIEDEAKARSLAKMNQTTFNDLMVESLTLQGRTAEAAQLEFTLKQQLFQEEMDNKLALKQITQATYNLAMDVKKLRQGAFDASRNPVSEGTFMSSMYQNYVGGVIPNQQAVENSVPDGYEVLGGDSVSFRGAQSITEASAAQLVDYAATQTSLLRRLVAAVEGGAPMSSAPASAPSTVDANRELGRRADTTALLVAGVVV